MAAGVSAGDDAVLGRFNVVVAGAGGPGSAAVVSAVFGTRTRVAGRLPESAPTILYRVHPDGYAGMYDLRGLARGSGEDRAMAALEQILQDTSVRPLPDQLHAVWYVMTWQAHDLFDEAGFPYLGSDDERRLRELARLLPVVVVVAGAPANLAGRPDPRANRYARYLQSLQLPLSSPGAVVLVNGRADPDLGPVHGVSELLTATFNAAPEAARRALAAAQAQAAPRRSVPSPTGLFNTARSVIADRLRPR
ncbi:MAG: hypothetical protein ACH36H_07400 [Candidatus Nanopelagicales bacterium]